jgi:hypothetical protein
MRGALSSGLFGRTPTILLVALSLLPCVLSAQSYRGAIRGSISDPSGGLVPNAKVQAKNNDTGLLRDTISSADGTYVLPELPAGIYTVTVNAPGFAEVAQNVVVNVGLDTTADFTMATLEQIKESVVVTEEAPIVEATRDDLGEVVDQRLVTELPLCTAATPEGSTVAPGTSATSFPKSRPLSGSSVTRR